MFTTGMQYYNIYQYTLGTAWDISTASYDKSKYVGFEDSEPIGLFIKSDSKSLYLVGNAHNTIYQYNFPTG